MTTEQVSVKIPFLERFREPMLAGVKTMTSRTKRYGRPGDTFEAWGQVFVLTAVYIETLGRVEKYWREEGCQSAIDFSVVWNQLHPRIAYSLDRAVWVHEFRLIKEKP